MDKQLTKQKIKNTVKGYKLLFSDEFNQFTQSMDYIRRIQANEFSSLKQDNGMVQRALFEIPENLYSSIIKTLDDNQLKYFKSKECARWFAKTFPEFALAQKI
jgi:hypothetical protein